MTDQEINDAIEEFEKIVYARSGHPNLIRESDLEAARKTLREFFSEAVIDTKRLDWLDKQTCGFHHEGYGDFTYYAGPKDNRGWAESPAREVIDRAMAKESK